MRSQPVASGNARRGAADAGVGAAVGAGPRVIAELRLEEVLDALPRTRDGTGTCPPEFTRPSEVGCFSVENDGNVHMDRRVRPPPSLPRPLLRVL